MARVTRVTTTSAKLHEQIKPLTYTNKKNKNTLFFYFLFYIGVYFSFYVSFIFCLVIHEVIFRFSPLLSVLRPHFYNPRLPKTLGIFHGGRWHGLLESFGMILHPPPRRRSCPFPLAVRNPTRHCLVDQRAERGGLSASSVLPASVSLPPACWIRSAAPTAAGLPGLPSCVRLPAVLACQAVPTERAALQPLPVLSALPAVRPSLCATAGLLRALAARLLPDHAAPCRVPIRAGSHTAPSTSAGHQPIKSAHI